MPGEWVRALVVPTRCAAQGGAARLVLAAYKNAKRNEQDISAVLTAALVALDADGRITRARAAFGGRAGIPKRAARAEAALVFRARVACCVTRCEHHDTMAATLLSQSQLPADYEWIRWQETNYASTRGGLGRLHVVLWLPPAGALRPVFVSSLNRALLPVVDAHGRMLAPPEDAADLWPLILLAKSALREHVTWQRLRIERGVFVAEAAYPRLRFDLLAAIAPPPGGSEADAAPEPGDADH